MPSSNLDVEALCCVPLTSVDDIVAARQLGRALAGRLGFSRSEITVVAAAISELARHIVEHAGKGEILLRSAGDGRRQGIVVVARSEGAGIGEVAASLSNHSREDLLPGGSGVQRVMDEIHIASERDLRTTITLTKWRG